MEKRSWRNIVVLCNDVECKFKQKNRGVNKLIDECALETSDAIEFFKKYGITTCEAGMGECQLCTDATINERILTRLKYKGRL
jgi:hypothetical protein